MRNNIFSGHRVGVLLANTRNCFLRIDGLERAGQPGEPRIMLCEKAFITSAYPARIYGDGSGIVGVAETIQHSKVWPGPAGNTHSQKVYSSLVVECWS